ncbi:MAG TPA: type II secretion system protein M [Steroidobacteraceae bacterium]|nr:type II secretion system protein M [Steroidobacteraceae bacterium]
MKLLEWYAALAQRERKLVLWGGVGAAALVLIFGVLWPLHSAVAGARHRVAQQSADLAWMRTHAMEVRSAAASMSGAGDSLVVVIDRSARELGLAEAIKSTTPTNSNGTRVELASVSFDMLAGWLARLQDQFGVTVVTATVEAAGGPGLVNASLELTRPGS